MNCVQRLGAARRMRRAAGLAPAILACAAFAASHGEHREQEAHEHGHGTLDIVAEGEELVIELRIPAVNVVGFEHAPRDDSEREAVRRALVPFGDAASVLVLSAQAECEVEEAEAGVSGISLADEHASDGHRDDERRDDGGHRHESDAHAEHEDDEHDSDSGMEAHSELHATYRFHCHAPERLGRIDVRVFEHLRDAEEIDVRVVTPAAQLAMELHPGSTVVELAP